MKKKKIVSIVCACFISALIFSGNSLAEEHTVSVNYTPSHDSIAPTQVKIVISTQTQEVGQIYDDNNHIVENAAVYEIKYGETKAFNIQPMIGYDVENIIYDGEDITDKLISMRSIQAEYFIEIVGLGYDTEFKVSYKKINGDIIDDSNHPFDSLKPGSNKAGISPNTGDTTNVYKFVIMAVVSMVVIITTLLIKRKKKDEENIKIS